MGCYCLFPAAGLEGAGREEGREELPESACTCGLDTGAERGLRESAGGLGPGDSLWVLTLQSERQWPWQGLWAELESVFLLWLG